MATNWFEYRFADGVCVYCAPMSAHELSIEISLHGYLVKKRKWDV